jgi:hypothetical protein
VRGDGPSKALELEVAGRRGLDGRLHRRKEALADEDLTRGCAHAQARSEVRHRPDDAVVVAALESNPAGYGRLGELRHSCSPDPSGRRR